MDRASVAAHYFSQIWGIVAGIVLNHVEMVILWFLWDKPTMVIPKVYISSLDRKPLMYHWPLYVCKSKSLMYFISSLELYMFNGHWYIQSFSCPTPICYHPIRPVIMSHGDPSLLPHSVVMVIPETNHRLSPQSVV